VGLRPTKYCRPSNKILYNCVCTRRLAERFKALNKIYRLAKYQLSSNAQLFARENQILYHRKWFHSSVEGAFVVRKGSMIRMGISSMLGSNTNL